MDKHTYPLATTTWDKEEYDAIQRVIKSGMFTMGPEVASFEKEFSNYIGSKYSVMVNSGSSANLMMIAALFYIKENALKAGDEVIVPAVSWGTTYHPLHQYGLKLKFVDIDLETLNYDLDALESAINEKTRLLMVVNLLGNPNNFDAISNLTYGKNIFVIEDNCESLGATYKNKKAGTFGIMGSFSSFFSHHISTMEGGLITTDNVELCQILQSLRAHGWTRNLPKENLVTGIKSDDEFEESFKFVLPGYNLRPLEISGAIGKEQLKKLPKLIDERRKNGSSLQDIMDGHPHLRIQKEVGQSSWFGFSLTIKDNSTITRQHLIHKLNKLGFETRPVVAGNFCKNEVIKYYNYSIHGNLKNADYIHENSLFIGNQHYSISEGLEQIKNITS